MAGVKPAAGLLNATPSFEDNIVAFAGGGQAGAYPLTVDVNRVVTVANAGDSVGLPKADRVYRILVINSHASHSINVFPFGASAPFPGDNINGAASNAAFALGAGLAAEFISVTPRQLDTSGIGRWYTLPVTPS